MEEVTLFIITTIYNARNSLKKTLDSLLLQTKTNFIHYIYDDASNENCDDIIIDYVDSVNKLDKPFTVIFEKGAINLGCDKAHEYGFKKAKGTHLMWLDSGDYLDNNCVEIITEEIINHKKIGWFHLNGVFYDINNNKIVSKPDNKSYKKRYLYKEDQLPSWVFGEFCYHVFVISIKEFYDAFCNTIDIIDKDKHGGCFYDAQIVLRMLATGKKMCYIKPILTYLMKDPQSVSTSYAGDSVIADKCIDDILNSNTKYYAFASFYLPYKDKVRKVQKMHLLCRTKNGFKKGLNNYKDLKLFLKNSNCKVNKYILNRFYYLFILFMGSNFITRRFL